MTESTTQQGLQQVNELNTESLEPTSESQSETITGKLGDEVGNAELTTGDILKSYKMLGSELGVSADSIRKNLKSIEKICEGFVTGLELTRKVGRKVMVTPEGQEEVRKFREIGADAYIRSLEDVFGSAEDEVIEELQPPTPQEPAGEMPGQLAQARPQSLAQSPRESKMPAALSRIQERSQNVGQQSTALTQQTANQQRNTLEQSQMRGGMQGVDAAAVEAQAMRQAYSKASGQFVQDFWNSLEDGFASATEINLATPEVDEYLGKSGESLQTSRQASENTMTDLWQGLSSSLNL